MVCFVDSNTKLEYIYEEIQVTNYLKSLNHEFSVNEDILIKNAYVIDVRNGNLNLKSIRIESGIIK